MIPYFQFNTIALGPITIQVWGLFVALGITAGITLAYFWAKKYLLSGEVVLDMAIWVLVGAFVMARVFHVVFYDPVFFINNPDEILKVWHGGASSLGGFVGAGLGLWLFAKKRKFTLKELLPYFDIGALALWLGWGIGRIGCFLIHDHPGTLTSFVLGVQYPCDMGTMFIAESEDAQMMHGCVRFDLGLMESITGFLLFIIFYILFKKLIKIRWGLVAGFSTAAYAVIRFFLDFLRIPASMPGGDVRYLYLTPAQWGMIGVLIGLTLALVLGKVKQQKVNGEVA